MKLFFFILQFVFLLNLHSQKTPYNPIGDTLRKNAVYVQALGNSRTVLSLNYEKRLFQSPNNLAYFFGRIGSSIGKNSFDSTLFYVLPLEFIVVIGKRTHFFEAGVGVTLNFGNSELKALNIPENVNSNFYYFYPVRFGYRLVEDNFFFRVSPLMTLLIPKTPGSAKLKGLWLPGISMGLMF